jgi:hypothetical protein
MWRGAALTPAFLLIFLLAPGANASPQGQQADGLGKQTGLPWAYGFSSPAPAEHLQARGSEIAE